MEFMITYSNTYINIRYLFKTYTTKVVSYYSSSKLLIF